MEHPDRLTAVEERAKSNTKRLDEIHVQIEGIERRQDDLESLTTSVAVMATKQEVMEGDVREIKSDVKGILALPAKRWNDLIEKCIWGVVGAALAYALARIF